MGKTELRGLPSAPGFAVEFGTHPIAGADPEAPPLVGIHCSGSSLKQWTALAEALARHPQVASRVVGVNLFGYGATTAWPEVGRPQTLDDSAALVDAALAAAGVDEPAHVVGHSHGGGVALRFAATRAVASVTAIEPNHFFLLETPVGAADAQGDRRAAVEDCARFCESMLASSMMKYRNWGPQFHDFWLRQRDGDAFDDLPERDRRALVDTTVPHTAHEIHSIYAARGAGAKRDLAALAAEGAKHLVLSPEPGLGSRRCLRALAAVLAARGFAATTLPAGGHLAPLTHAAETADRIATLLAAALEPPPRTNG